MVYNCSLLDYESNTKNTEFDMAKYFDKYPYKLHNFQKWAIEGIVTGNHVLVTAPTGSGKTLPGEFAITHLFNSGGKTIYCSPIKALSNQKFHDFSVAYPHIKFGLITGDIKMNPDADVLIMTTEILKNKLAEWKYGQKNDNLTKTNNTNFDLDIDNELKCVIFDEIHMINDVDRGHVWEQCLMQLPKNIQIIGLSATLNSPERFANWIEQRYAVDNSHKIVYFASRSVRAVPLTHYAFITGSQPTFKSIKDKSVRDDVINTCGKLIPLADPSGTWMSKSYHKVNSVLHALQKNGGKINCFHAINTVATHLTNENMTPAICYVFSKKHLDLCANKVTVNLLEFDSKIPYTIDHDCESIIRKMPNFNEYLKMPEYIRVVHLLQKGIGIHHAGMIPVLREMIEILFARGKIKLLFATETVSVGLNLPVKTTIFTDITKFDGNQFRVLKPHEYTQAAGRAGRLGLDDVGHVVHLNNLFRPITETEYKHMMTGPPQTLSSKFRISPNYVLNCIRPETSDNSTTTSILDIVHEIEHSSYASELTSQANGVKLQLEQFQQKILTIDNSIEKCCTIPKHIIDTYIELVAQTSSISRLGNSKKQMKTKTNDLNQIKENYPTISNEIKQYEHKYDIQKMILDAQNEYDNIISSIENTVRALIDMLVMYNLITFDKDTDICTLTTIGNSASKLHEVNCIVFANIIHSGKLDGLSQTQLVQLFSCFTSFRIIDQTMNDNNDNNTDININSITKDIEKEFDNLINIEHRNKINTGCNYDIHDNLIPYTLDWCNATTEDDYKNILSNVVTTTGLQVGEFIKAMLKITTIAAEIEQIALNIGNIELAEKLSSIPKTIFNHIVTFQSLYI
jgi:superfamily II RNA helicase